MIFKTVQPVSILEQVYSNQAKIYSNSHTLKDNQWSFWEAYEWMKTKKMQMIGTKSPTGQLLWAWEYESPNNIKMANEMIDYQIRGFSGDCVILTFNKNKKDILLSDHSFWEYVINYWAIPQGKKEINFWECAEAKENINFYQEKPLKNEKFHQLVEESWEQAFRVKKNKQTNDYNFALPQRMLNSMGIKKEDCLIQATLWDIVRNDITEIQLIKA